MEFQNYNTPIRELPSIVDVNFHTLEDNYLKVKLIASFLLYCIPILMGLIVFYIDDPRIPRDLYFLFIGSFLLLLFLSLVSSYIGFRYKAYGLRSHDVIYRSGWIWRNETVIPFNRIQHVEIAQGPLERYYKLAKLKIFTAGGSQSDLVIPGLELDSAHKIKAFLIDKSKDYV